MSSLNRVILIGRCGADPEIRTFQNGGRVANLRLATSQRWKSKETGEKQERTEWHQLSVRGDGLVGVVEKYVHKGSQIAVEGSLRTRKYQAQDGTDRYTTEVIVTSLTLLDSKREDDGDSRSSDTGQSYGAAKQGDTSGAGYGGGGSGFGGNLDDEIPFACEWR